MRNIVRLQATCLFASVSLLVSLGHDAPVRSMPQPTSATVVEQKAMSLLKKAQDTMFRLKTYQAECRTTVVDPDAGSTADKPDYEFATLRAQKPNKMRYEAWQVAAQSSKPSLSADTVYACNGITATRQIGNSYQKDTRVSPNFMATGPEPWRGFYTSNVSPYALAINAEDLDELKEARITGREAVNGTQCEKVNIRTVRRSNAGVIERRTTWYIGSDFLVHRCVDSVTYGDKPGPTRDAVLTKMVLNAAMDAEVFAYTPPKQIEERQPSTYIAAATAHHTGTSASDFTALDAAGKPVKLSDYRGKVVVLDFWASWCGPCMASMPHNQAVMNRLKQEGLPVVLLAVDDGEERSRFEGWVKTSGSQYHDLTFVHSPPDAGVSGNLFGVTGIPTQFVLDGYGVICAKFVGYGGPSDELEMAIKAALK